jgi:DNA integrity scanning protein DisA with diadenylate cyclase activity
MSINLPPILHNNRLNSIINVSAFNYQNNSISYYIGDSRYTLSSIYKSAVSSINSAISTLQNTDISLQNQINSLNYDAWTKLITQATTLSGSNNLIASTFGRCHIK